MKKILLFYLILLFPTVYAGCGRQTEIPLQEGYFEVEGSALYYRIVGKGEPVIVIHGGPLLDHSYIEPYLRPLARSYKLVYYDQRLSGRTSADSDSSRINMATFVNDIENLRSGLELGKIHLAGHSWGGLIAMHYALKYQEHLESLILLNPMPASTELWKKEEELLAQKNTPQDSADRQKIIESDSFKNEDPESIKQLLKISFRNQFYDPSYSDSLNFYIPDDFMDRSKRFGAMMPDLLDYDLHEQLKTIRIPALLLYGSIEAATAMSGIRLDQIFPRSRLSVIEMAGHFPFIEQQEDFLDELNLFLDQHQQCE